MDYEEAIQNADAILKKSYDSIDIVLAAHVLEPRGRDNTVQLNCSETEHFTTQEFYEVYSGIVDAGFFIRKVFFSEFDFLRDLITGPEEYSATVVFNLCRNGTGMNKKTVMPAICDLLGVTFTSSSAGICALARNKLLYTLYLHSCGIRCPVSGQSAEEINDLLLPDTLVIRKPNGGSASQGVDLDSVVTLEEAIQTGGSNMLVQEYIDGYECEVPVFCSAGQCFAMPPVGISFGADTFTGIVTYSNSLNNEYGFYDFSDIVCIETCKVIMNDAVKVFTKLGLEKYGRVDFRVNKRTHRHYLMDVSTTPYITKHSSFAFSMENSGKRYSDIFRLIIAAALFQKMHDYSDRN